MTKRKLLKILTVAISAGALLTACGQKKATNKTNENETVAVTKLKNAVPQKATKKGGSVKVGLISDSPFTGIFDSLLSVNGVDQELSQFGIESLFGMDDEYAFNNKGAAKIAINQKKKTVTIKIKKGVKWSDGKQVTAKDYEYGYEIVANPATKSQNYNSALANIVGLEEYHNGQSKTISGIKMPDGANGRKVVLHFKKMMPGMKQSGNGYFLQVAEPYHYLKKVPFSKLTASKQIRKKPLFYGPYQVDKLVDGESVVWKPNKYYWRGQPKLDKIEASIISTKMATKALEKNRFDVINVVNSEWTSAKKNKQFNFVKNDPFSYNYLGFRVGKWQNGRNIMAKDAKMNNKALRQAIAYGMNTKQWLKQPGNELSYATNSLIPKQFGDYYDSSVKGYEFNLKKANQLLDQAGYKKRGTYRVQPNGKKLTINFAVPIGYDSLAQDYIQQWKKLGLRVKMVGGRTMPLNLLLNKLQNDDPGIDMFMNGWQLTTEPSPVNLYGAKTPLNYGHFVTKKNTELINEIDSAKAFNHQYRVEKFHEWQKYMNDEAYVLPVYSLYRITAVNKKLTGFSYAPAKLMGNPWPNWYYVAYAK